jgi:hypothetical protein
LHSYLVRKTPTIVFPDKTDYNLYEVIFLFAAALYIFNFENYNICNLHIEKIQVFKFKYESTRERERESKRAREREREMKKGKGEKYANATRCHLPPTHQSKFS